MPNKNTLRALVQSFYDAQKLRIEAGNRLTANIRTRLGQKPGTKTEKMPGEAQRLLNLMVLEYRRLADAYTSERLRRRVQKLTVQDGVLAEEFDVQLVGHYVRLLDDEAALSKAIERAVEEFPVWRSFLKGVKGCGPIMAAVLISYLDPHKARHVSSYWKFTGLDVAPDGKARSRRKEHLVARKYTDKNGKEAEKLSLTYNPFLRAKLLGVLAACFLRSKSPYRDIYDDYKRRLENHITHKHTTPGHRHRMAVRYMVKMFLKDLWIAMRQAENLPVTPDYAEAKLGLKHKETVA